MWAKLKKKRPLFLTNIQISTLPEMFFILFRRIPGEAGNAKKKNNNKKKIQYYCNMASIVFFLNPQSHLLTNQMEHTGENLQAPVGEHCNGQN